MKNFNIEIDLFESSSNESWRSACYFLCININNLSILGQILDIYIIYVHSKLPP